MEGEKKMEFILTVWRELIVANARYRKVKLRGKDAGTIAVRIVNGFPVDIAQGYPVEGGETPPRKSANGSWKQGTMYLRPYTRDSASMVADVLVEGVLHYWQNHQ